MKSRVSSTVTKRKANPRPRKYASASERQAAYRARAPEVCFRAEQKTVETLDRIAETLDQSRADVLLSMTKFALANHDWARFGLTHKPLPFEYGVNPIMGDDIQRVGIFNVRYVRKGEQLGPRNKSGKTIGPAAEPVVEFYDSRYPHTKRGQFVSSYYARTLNEAPWGEGLILDTGSPDWQIDRDQLLEVKRMIATSGDFGPVIKRKINPMKTTRAKRKPTPAQLAARERFAEMARRGAFKKAGGRKANPAKKTHVWRITVFDDDGKPAKVTTDSTEQGALLYAKSKADANLSGEIHYIMPKSERLEFWFDGTGIHPAGSYGNRPIYTTRRAALKTNPTRKAAEVRRNPSSWGTAPLKKVRSVIARSKTTGERRTFMMADSSGVKVPTPYDFGFRLEIEGEMFDFVGRYEGPLLIISEKSTGLRLPGDVGFTLRSSYGDDKNAAKRWTLDLIERVTPQKFAQKVRAAR